MSTEKMREDFEAWYSHARRSAYDEPDLGKDKIGQYFDTHAHESWVNWQASRSCIEVEFPPSPYMPDSEPDSMSGYEIREAQGRCDMWAALRAAIESIGLKIKQ